MSTLVMSAIEVDRIGRQQAMHEAAHIPPGRLQDQVHVVGHQTEEIQPHLKALATLPQASQKTRPVVVRPKDVAAVVAAYRDVVYRPPMVPPLSAGWPR